MEFLRNAINIVLILIGVAIISVRIITYRMAVSNITIINRLKPDTNYTKNRLKMLGLTILYCIWTITVETSLMLNFNGLVNLNNIVRICLIIIGMLCKAGLIVLAILDLNDANEERMRIIMQLTITTTTSEDSKEKGKIAIKLKNVSERVTRVFSSISYTNKGKTDQTNSKAQIDNNQESQDVTVEDLKYKQKVLRDALEANRDKKFFV